MEVIFADGVSGNQRDLVQETIANSLYDFDRIVGVVQVAVLENPTDVPLGGGHVGRQLAYTQVLGQPPYIVYDGWNSRLPDCRRPQFWRISLRKTLDEPSVVDPFSGPLAFRDTFHHELGHVFTGKLHSTHVKRLCDIYGAASTSQWNGTESTPWTDLVKEGFAETFKDVYLPRELRAFDNRTKWVLRRERYDAWLDIIDEICPCGVAA